MIGTNPVDQAMATIGDTTVSGETTMVALPQRPGLPEDPSHLRFLVYVGMLDLLADAGLALLGTDHEQEELLARSFATTMAAEPVLKFARHGRSARAERHELIARMRGRDIDMTDGWLIPRLERDIAAYRARIDGLRRAIEERTP